MPDEAEPQAGRSSTPILLIGLFALIAYWGMVHLDTTGGGFSGNVYYPYGDGVQVESAQFHDPRTDMLLRGKRVFLANCSPCHQNTGLGLPGQFPPLAGSDWVNAKTPNRVVRIVLCGLQGPLTLNGQPFTTSAQMTPFRDTLPNDEDIAAVLSFVRSNKEWNNSASDVTPDQVKAIREKVKSHGPQFTPDELTKVPENE
jgi:mono/diheme cytochrome c family protein